MESGGQINSTIFNNRYIPAIMKHDSAPAYARKKKQVIEFT